MASPPSPGPAASLRDLPLGPAVVVHPGDSLAVVSRALAAAGASCALLDGRPVRIVTEADLAAAWGRGAVGSDPVARHSTGRPFWVPASVSVAEAAGLMLEHGVRHLIVVDEAEGALGTLAMRDLFVALLRAHDPVAVYATFASTLLR